MIDERLKIIDKLCEKHPSYGVPHNLAEYVGGMKDSGQWFVRRMLDVDTATLQGIYDKILAIENAPKQPELTAEEQWEALKQFRKECDERAWYGKV